MLRRKRGKATQMPHPESEPQIPRARSNQQSIDMLEKALAEALAGNILSVCVVAERTDGSMMQGFTECGNIYTMGGAIVSTGMRRMTPNQRHLAI
jgi:hypothetical protein